MRDRPPEENQRRASHLKVAAVDREILGYVAGHPVVLFSQVKVLLATGDAEVSERLEALLAGGMVRRAPGLRHQHAFQITPAGLAETGSDRRIPRVDLRHYWHNIAVAWLSVAVRRGMFGPVERIYSRWEMQEADSRAADRESTIGAEWSEAVRAKAADALFGLSLAGEDSEPSGVHYPDVLLVLPQGRIAMELFWEASNDRIFDTLLDAYARKLTVVAVVFFYVEPAVGDRLRAATAAHGLENRVRIEAATLDMAAK